MKYVIIIYPNIFFPASGHRDNNYGDIYVVGSAGYYYFSDAIYMIDVLFLYFNSIYVYPLNAYDRSSGLTVRL